MGGKGIDKNKDEEFIKIKEWRNLNLGRKSN